MGEATLLLKLEASKKLRQQLVVRMSIIMLGSMVLVMMLLRQWDL